MQPSEDGHGRCRAVACAEPDDPDGGQREHCPCQSMRTPRPGDNAWPNPDANHIIPATGFKHREITAVDACSSNQLRQAARELAELAAIIQYWYQSLFGQVSLTQAASYEGNSSQARFT